MRRARGVRRARGARRESLTKPFANNYNSININGRLTCVNVL